MPRNRHKLPKKNRSPRRTIWIGAAVASLVVLAIGLAFLLVHGGGQARSPLGASVATFVGSETCAQCHPAEAKLWRSSQHKLAMDHATDKSEIGRASCRKRV